VGGQPLSRVYIGWDVGYVRVMTTSPRGSRSRHLFLVAAVLWLVAAAISAVRLVATIADPDRDTSPVVSVLIAVLFAAAALVWLVQYRRTR